MRVRHTLVAAMLAVAGCGTGDVYINVTDSNITANLINSDGGVPEVAVDAEATELDETNLSSIVVR